MGTIARLRDKRWYWYTAAIALSGGLLLPGVSARVAAQGANSIYVTPASGNYATGSTVSVSVRFNVSQPVNAVQADMTYSSNLEFVGIDGSGSALSIDASSTGGSGSVSIARGSTTPASGDQLLARVTFKAVSAGTGTVQMQNSSTALASSNNQNVVTTRNSGSFTLEGAAQPSPPPSTPSAPPKVTPSAPPGVSKVTIASSAGGSQTGVPDNSKIELEAPAVLEVNPEAGREVVKVEYLIDGRIVSVSTTAPYRHSIDTKDMRNGSYELVTKTYYKDGHIDESKATLKVSNPFGMKQVLLQAKRFAWVGGILLLAVLALLFLKFFKKPKWTPPSHKDTFGPSSGIGTPVVGGSGPVFGGGSGDSANDSSLASRPGVNSTDNDGGVTASQPLTPGGPAVTPVPASAAPTSVPKPAAPASGSAPAPATPASPPVSTPASAPAPTPSPETTPAQDEQPPVAGPR